MTNAHTPGPWTWSEPPGAGIEVRGPYKGSTRLLFSDIWRQFPEPAWDAEMRANARLITAAPDLLEALQQLFKNANRSSIDPFTLNLAAAAIAKATSP